MDDDLEPVQWHPKLGLKGLLFGLVTGLGLAGLTQQLGWIPFGTTIFILWLIGGVVLGIAFSSIGYALGVARVNRRIEREQETEHAEGSEGEAAEGASG